LAEATFWQRALVLALLAWVTMLALYSGTRWSMSVVLLQPCSKS
jgi:hypothetical protein